MRSRLAWRIRDFAASTNFVCNHCSKDWNRLRFHQSHYMHHDLFRLFAIFFTMIYSWEQLEKESSISLLRLLVSFFTAIGTSAPWFLLFEFFGCYIIGGSASYAEAYFLHLRHGSQSQTQIDKPCPVYVRLATHNCSLRQREEREYDSWLDTVHRYVAHPSRTKASDV